MPSIWPWSIEPWSIWPIPGIPPGMASIIRRISGSAIMRWWTAGSAIRRRWAASIWAMNAAWASGLIACIRSRIRAIMAARASASMGISWSMPCIWPWSMPE